MKVLQVVHDLRLGGAERIAVTLCRGLVERGAQVTLLAVKGAGPQAKDLPQGDGFTMEILGVKRRPSWMLPLFLWDFARLLFGVMGALRRHRPDVVQTHIPEDDLVLCLAMIFTGIGVHVPLVHSMHFYPDREGRGLRTRLRTRAYRWMAGRAGKVFAVSEPVAAEFSERVGVPRSQLEVLSTGIDLSRFENPPSREMAREALSLPSDRSVVLALGRVVRAKNYPGLVKSSRIVLEKFPDTLFVLVGDGDRMEAVKKEIAVTGVEASWVLLGSRSDVPLVLAVADLFVQSSDWEGLPVAVLEAMACRLPVVATAAGGTPNIIKDGETGRLVAVGDPTALADALLDLLADPQEAIKLGEAGFELVRSQYNQDAFLDREMSLLQACSGNQG
jgi:glycosyltransferase involved in cell wall biosynthesis